MAKKEKYRLAPLLKLKLRNKRLAEIALAKAIKALEKEKEKLKTLEELKKEIQGKRENARTAMREKISSGQSKIKESHFHLGYMEKLKEDEARLEIEITEQKENLLLAEGKLKRTRRDYIDAASEMNVMEKHKELFDKKQARALSALENKQMGELGNTVHQMNRMRAE